MQTKEAARLRESWGNKPCNHIRRWTRNIIWARRQVIMSVQHAVKADGVRIGMKNLVKNQTDLLLCLPKMSSRSDSPRISNIQAGLRFRRQGM